MPRARRATTPRRTAPLRLPDALLHRHGGEDRQRGIDGQQLTLQVTDQRGRVAGGAGDEDAATPDAQWGGGLLHGIVKGLRVGAGVRWFGDRVGRDADDLDPLALRVYAEAATEGVEAAEVRPRHRLRDHGHARAARLIAGVDGAARQHGNPHHVEEAGRRLLAAGVDHSLA